MSRKIEWTDTVWNPVRGCSLVSAGCANCYAMKQAHRFSAEDQPYWRLTELGPHGPRWNGNISMVPKALQEPLTWRKPRRVFVNSMSDLFHEGVPDGFIADVFGVMASARQHTFQILTKRPDRMLEWMTARMDDRREWAPTTDYGRSIVYQSQLSPWPLPNVWLGVSVENQQTADERIPLLLQTPAAVRFVSCEPLLAPISFRWAAWVPMRRDDGRATNHLDGLRGINWIICGGESGPGARPCNVEWIRSTKDQCKAAGVACFIKQLGREPFCLCRQCGRPVGHVLGGMVDSCGPTHALLIEEMAKIRDSKGGDCNEWPTDLKVREYPA